MSQPSPSESAQGIVNSCFVLTVNCCYYLFIMARSYRRKTKRGSVKMNYIKAAVRE